MTDTIVVLGKRTVRKTELPHLHTFGAAMAIRSKQLITTKTEGAPAAIASAYMAAGGTPIYMTGADYQSYTEEHPVVVFTDTKYEAHLDKIAPNWRSANWTVIHNPKATQEAADYLTQILLDLGTPLTVASS